MNDFYVISLPFARARKPINPLDAIAQAVAARRVARKTPHFRPRRAALSLLLLIGACSTAIAPVVDPTPALLQPVTAAQRDNLAGDTKAVAKDLDAEVAAIKTVAAQDMAVQKTEAAERAQLKDQDSWWWGPRMHRWFKIIAWIGIPLLTILGGVLIYTGQVGTGLSVGTVIAHIFLGVFTGGIHWAHLLIIWFAALFTRHVAKVNAAKAVKVAAKAAATPAAIALAAPTGARDLSNFVTAPVTIGTFPTALASSPVKSA